MDNRFIWEYVQSCALSDPAFADCKPVWEFGAISTLLLLAVVTFFILVTDRHHDESRLASL